MEKPLWSDAERSENFRVLPEISLLNKYVQRAKKVAISAINPVSMVGADGSAVNALNIRVEGPARYLSYFNKLIDEANLKIS